jgi:hypothetical protein
MLTGQTAITSAIDSLATATEAVGRSANERDKLNNEMLRLLESTKLAGDLRHTENLGKFRDVEDDIRNAEMRITQAISNGKVQHR